MKINDLNKKLAEFKSLLSQDEITKVKEGEKDKIVKKLQNDKKLLAEQLQNSKIVIAKLARTPKTPTGLGGFQLLNLIITELKSHMSC